MDAKYKNPRNLCSGSVRQLNSEITAQRHVQFYGLCTGAVRTAWILKIRRKEQFEWLADQGFEVVEYRGGDRRDTCRRQSAEFAETIRALRYPVGWSGAVCMMISPTDSRLGRTAKFPRDSIAFKWADEIQETTLSLH